jgi:hypothetical protein
MKIVSGRTGSPHVTSQQFRQMLEGIIGQGSYIITSGENLKPELSSNNLLKIRSGMMAHHGCISCVDIGTYDEVTLTNGSQGTKRIDLIVNRYTRNAETEVENCSWKVIQGTPVASNPAAPAYTSGNLQDGDLVDDCPAFEVHYDGINVTEVKSLLSVTDGLSELNSKLSVYVLEEKECSPKDTGENQWKYRKWSNGSVEIWRIGGNVDTFTVSRSSANGIYYSDEIVWYPIDMPLKITKIDQILATIDRKGNDGLPNVNIVNAFTENGCPFIKFIITANRTGQFKVSTNFYIQARWK